MGTPNGLNRLDLETMQVKVFTTRNGLASSEIHSLALSKDGLGRLWIGTSKGLTCFKTSMDWMNETAPPVHISRITLRGGEHSPSGETGLPYYDSTIKFESLRVAFPAACGAIEKRLCF